MDRSRNGTGCAHFAERRQGVRVGCSASGHEELRRLMVETPAPIISVQKVTKRFPGVVALVDVTLDILPGELHSVCGENGAGKSTLMKILSGVIPDFDGDLLLAGKPVRFAGTRDAEAAGICIIHQELNLVEQL